MKPIQVVLNQALRCNSYVACLCSSLLSVAVTAFALSSHHNPTDDTELTIARELAMLTPLDAPKLLQRAIAAEEQVKFVADVIRHEFPTHPDSDTLARIIVTESRSADIDPLLVTAVIRTESTFRHKAVSRRGAKGLMQLMPETGKYVAKLSNIELKNTEELHNPETNIKLGIWYLKHLEQRFQGCREKLLVAYNWGPTNLARALSSSVAYPSESVQYAHKVLSRHSLWSKQLALYSTAQGVTALG